MIEQTLAEWRAEFKSRFPVTDDAAFVCPSCSQVQTVRDFKARGIDPQHVYSQCGGRFPDGPGCNWAAFGFLKTLGKGRIVDGEEIFDFAEVG